MHYPTSHPYQTLCIHRRTLMTLLILALYRCYFDHTILVLCATWISGEQDVERTWSLYDCYVVAPIIHAFFLLLSHRVVNMFAIQNPVLIQAKIKYLRVDPKFSDAFITPGKFVVEALQCTDVFLHSRAKACQPIVVLTFFLHESAPGDNADTCVVEQLERVERIRLFSRFASRLDRLGGQVNAREQVECARRVDARHAGERVESGGHGLGALRERGVRRVGLGFPQRVARVGGLW